MRLTGKDERLIAEATAIIRRLYKRRRHHIGAAVEMEDGRIFTAVHLAANVGSGDVCAEAAALAKAISEGASRVRRIVAVKYFTAEDRAKVVSPCGTCRELVSDYGDALVIYSVGGQVRKDRIGRLLPAKYDE